MTCLLGQPSRWLPVAFCTPALAILPGQSRASGYGFLAAELVNAPPAD